MFLIVLLYVKVELGSLRTELNLKARFHYILNMASSGLRKMYCIYQHYR